MKTLLEDLLKKYPDTQIDENSLPRLICPDDLGYISLCEEGFDIRVELCRNCWNQPIEQDNNDAILHFGEDFPDGRLTMPSTREQYEIKKAIKEVERLGRTLTSEEFKQFVKNNGDRDG